MTLVLRWRQRPPPIQLRWRGLDGATADAISAGADPAPIAAIVGPPGDQGVPGTLSAYEHVQNSAATSWTVNHNLGRTPAAVRILSPGGLEVEAEVLNISANQLAIGFAAPATGRAIVM